MTVRDRESPLRYLVHVARLPAKGMNVRFMADDEQLKALAKDHDLLKLERLDVDLLVAPWKRDGVKVTGTVTADIVRECVVTLEPLASVLEADIEATFVPEGSRLARPDQVDGEMVLDAEGPDLPEEFSGQEIDVGSLAEEHFTLAIDPYPRAPGTTASDYFDSEDKEPRGPLYDQLKGLRGQGGA